LSDATARYLDVVSGRARGLRPMLQRAALRVASWPYRGIVAIRNLAFDRGWKTVIQAGVPVVSVGNLTLGGTGKTPCVEYVARFCRERDLQVAILSRGYGSHAGPNDEALVLEENLPDVPHLQGADRAALALTAVEELESELLILDDGFQHRRLGRNLDLVLIDATCPWGYGYLTPRGLLREPPKALRRAAAVILTRCDQVDGEALTELKQEVAHLAPNVVLVEATHRPMIAVNSDHAERPLDQFRGQAAFAFCGIGNPNAFRRTLEQLGVEVRDFRTFPDHHPYQRADVESLDSWCEQLLPTGVVLTTQKDLVKLQISRLAGRELWAVRIGLTIRQGEDLLHKLLNQIVTG
jgi:tetraacyldisaccharide 4'-kinase